MKKEKKEAEHGRSFIFTKVVKRRRKENVSRWAFAQDTRKRERWPGRDNERSM